MSSIWFEFFLIMKLLPFTILSLLLVQLTLASPVFKSSSRKWTPESKIFVTFEKQMVGDDQVGKVAQNTLVKVTPEVRGMLKWHTPNKAEFIPGQLPIIGIKYKLEIVAEASHLDGSAIQRGNDFLINSESFDVVRSRTIGESLAYSRSPKVYLAFNDEINAENMPLLIYFQDKSGVKVPVKARTATWADCQSDYYRVKPRLQRFREAINPELKEIAQLELADEAPLSTAVVIEPIKPLPIGQNWYLVIPADTPNKSRTARTARSTSQWIGDLNALEIDNITPTVEANQPRTLKIHFNYPLDQSTIDKLPEYINLSPKLANIRYQLEDDKKTLTIKGQFSQRDSWNITIKKGLSSINGLYLAEDDRRDFTFYRLAPGIALPSFITAQQLHGSRDYNIDTVNIDSARIRIKHLDAEQAVRAMLGYQHYTGWGHNGQTVSPKQSLPFSLVSGKSIYDSEIFLDNKIDTSAEIKLSWNEVLQGNRKPSLMFASVEGKAKKLAPNSGCISQSIIQLTDIGLSWKQGAQQTMIYGFSYNNGKPIPNFTIKAYGDDAQFIEQYEADQNGVVILANNDSITHLVASKDDDQYIVPFDRQMQNISMWRFPINYSWDAPADKIQKLSIFTDRSLYRPGEQVNLKALLRQLEGSSVKFSDIKSAKLIINDSRSRSLISEDIEFSEKGAFDKSFTLPNETVGYFTVEFKLVGPAKPESISNWRWEQMYNFRSGFHVQEFRRNAFEVSSQIDEPEIASEKITWSAKANYYQGMPVASARVAWHLFSRNVGFYPEKFRDYKFGNHRHYDYGYWAHYYGYNDSYQSESNVPSSKSLNGNLLLDEDGNISKELEVPASEFPSPLMLSVTAEVTDSREQTLTTNSNTTIHPCSIYLGISRINKLMRIGDSAELDILAVDLNGKLAEEDQELEVSVERVYHETTKVRNSDGKMRVNNEERISKISSSKLTIPAGKSAKFAFSSDLTGEHLITLTSQDKQGRTVKTVTAVHVYGANDYAWSTEDGNKIKLVPEQKTYTAGDTARILVMTPIDGTALVTLERENVMQHFQMQLSSEKPVIEIPIDAELAPNAFVSVMVVRGALDSPHKYKHADMRIGYCEFAVLDPAKELEITIIAPSHSSLPASEITLSGSVKDAAGKPAANADVTLFAVDEGTLAVMGYNNPNWLKFFFAARPLSMTCGNSFSNYLSENPELRYMANKGFVIGGDDAFAAAPRLDIATREDFDPSAAWRPTVMTDKKGNFSVSFTTPDTLTTYRVVALAAQGADQFGSSTSSFVVDKELMLEPMPPRYVSEGDQLEPMVLVQNNSDYDGSWEVTLETNDICQLVSTNGSSHSSTKSIQLKKGQSAEVSFPINVSKTGTVQWTWSAKPSQLAGATLDAAMIQRHSDNITNSFESTYPTPLLTQVVYARIDGNTALADQLDTELLAGRGQLEVTVSNSRLLEAAGAADYLLKYPYGCVEQTTSSMMPWLTVNELKHIVPAFKEVNEADVMLALQKGADRLLSMQTTDGGLAYWPSGSSSERWASSYGAMALILAEKRGAKVDNSSLTKLTNWIIKDVRKSKIEDNDWNNDILCRTLYVLALAEQPQRSIQNRIYEDRDQLSQTAKSFLAMAIDLSGGDRETALSLVEKKTSYTNSSSWMAGSTDSSTRLMALSQLKAPAEMIDDAVIDLLASRSANGNWRSTWINSWALQGMASYEKSLSHSSGSSKYSLTSNQGTVQGSIDKTSSAQHHVFQLENGQSLVATSDTPLFAKLSLSAKPQSKETTISSSGGLAIDRRYTVVQADGSELPLDKPSVGDLVKVTLTISFPSDIRYVAIEDRLPSVFEIINDHFDSQSSVHSAKISRDWRISHRELRGDKARFFLNKSWSGEAQQISYLARVAFAGTATAPAAKVEAMYDPSMRANTASATISTQQPVVAEKSE